MTAAGRDQFYKTVGQQAQGAGQHADPRAPVHVPDLSDLPEDRHDSHPCYEVVAVTRSMLSLEVAPRVRRAFPYAFLEEVDYTDPNLLVLHFPQWIVTIKGRNMDPVYKALIDHRAVRITSVRDDFGQGGSEGQTVITTISIDKQSDAPAGEDRAP